MKNTPHKKVEHCIGLQGLWPPYSVAYYGARGAFCFFSDAPVDRILTLDALLEKIFSEVGHVLSEGVPVALAFPQGPGPFTGLRAVGAFACGLQADKEHVVFCTPTAFDLCADKLPEGQEVCVALPHHKRAVFLGLCQVQGGFLQLKSLDDVAHQDAEKNSVPVYWCDVKRDDALTLPPITAHTCAHYAWVEQKYTKAPQIMYGLQKK